jgi:6-phosphofructokinase 1
VCRSQLPKTIDNTSRTDRSFGFDTAVAIVTEALDRLQTTGRSHGRVMILETMGRYAGWIALHAGLAGGADIILIPELPYRLDEVARVCRERQARERYTVICIAEGARPEGGSMTVKERIEDSPEPIRLGGVGNVLRSQLEPMLGCGAHHHPRPRAAWRAADALRPRARRSAARRGTAVARKNFNRVVVLQGAD